MRELLIFFSYAGYWNFWWTDHLSWGGRGERGWEGERFLKWIRLYALLGSGMALSWPINLIRIWEHFLLVSIFVERERMRERERVGEQEKQRTNERENKRKEKREKKRDDEWEEEGTNGREREKERK